MFLKLLDVFESKLSVMYLMTTFSPISKLWDESVDEINGKN